MKIALIRTPYLSFYNQLDVREEPVLSSAAQALLDHDIEFTVFDFHLDRNVTADKVSTFSADFYIIAVRGTGLHWKYARQITGHLIKSTNAQIILYGQTGKLKYWLNPDPARVSILPQSEKLLLKSLGFPVDYPDFGKGYSRQHLHYASMIWDNISNNRQTMFKPTIESTRGCHFGCTFCFINHGTNYPQRFARQSSSALLEDIQHFNSFGHKDFWLYDSEFVGGRSSDYHNVDRMLDVLKDSGADNSFMLYNRANTLNMYNNYDRLKLSGVSTVLMGLESFDQNDLRALKKGGKPSDGLRAIEELVSREIFCNLNFILFNRATTIQSLRANLDTVISLYEKNGYGFLGPIFYFSYSFESDWRDTSGGNYLSQETQLSLATGNTTTPKRSVAFDPKLEPYAEFCRVLNYEHIAKICQLNLAKSQFDEKETVAFNEWATLANLFVLNLMHESLSNFEAGQLRLDNVSDFIEDSYASWRAFNRHYLPSLFHEPATQNEQVGLDWNGWHPIIPFDERY